MRPPKSLGDWVFFLVIAAIVFVMGVLMLIYPQEPIPEQKSAYREHIGVLEEVLERGSGRRLSYVKFRLSKDPAIYESRMGGIHELSSNWLKGQTSLRFYSVLDAQEPGTLKRPLATYGLVSDGVVSRTLEADIEYHNAAISRFGGVLAMGIGALAFVVAVLVWSRKRAGQALIRD